MCQKVFTSQVFVTTKTEENDKELDKKVFILRKRASHLIPSPGKRFYICSLSRRTVVYKGLLTSDQLWQYFVDLDDPLFDTYLALVHTRFSTNTFPSWERAHPLRYKSAQETLLTVDQLNFYFLKNDCTQWRD